MISPKAILMFIQNLATRPWNRELTTPTLNDVNGMANKTRIVTEILHENSEKIKVDHRLSNAGQQTKIGALATDMLPEYAFLKHSIDVMKTKLANIDAQLFSVKPVVTDPVLRQLRNAEVRDGLRGLDANDRNTQFLRAAEQDLNETLDSMLDSPTGPLVSADAKRRGLDERGKRLKPELYAQRRQDQLFLDSVTELRELCVSCLISMGADPVKVEQVLGPIPKQEDEPDSGLILGRNKPAA